MEDKKNDFHETYVQNIEALRKKIEDLTDLFAIVKE
jgi:phage host-nuclease inhibitor protein Gam